MLDFIGLLERNDMKKLLIILFCFYISNVSALEYSDYTPFSDYTDKEVISDEFTDVKVERRYKYYKYVREDGPYESEDIINNDYPFTDENDYIHTLESEYLDEKPLEKNGRIITEHTVYHHLKADDINCIKFYNTGTNSFLSYSNLKVTYKGKDIDYNVVYSKASESFIEPNGVIEIKFDEKIDVRYLKIMFDMLLYFGNKSDLYIYLGNDEKKVGQAVYMFLNDISRNIEFDGIDMDTYRDAFIDYYSDKILETRPTIVYHDTVTKYTYKDILYRKYNLIKEYSNDYLTLAVDNYIYKDDKKYKDYYAYRTRSLLNNELIIVSRNLDSEPKRENTVYKELSNSLENFNTKLPSYSKAFSNYSVKKYDHDILDEENKDELIYYFSYILILIVILILVLSKLYKNYVKCAKV